MSFLSPKEYVELAYWSEVSGEKIREILNDHGGCRMTVCPECKVDDFVHIEGCTVGDQVDKLLE